MKQPNNSFVPPALLVQTAVQPAGPNQSQILYKPGIVLEEADESLNWLEISNEAKFGDHEEIDILIKGATEIVRIFSKADMTAKRNQEISKSRNQK